MRVVGGSRGGRKLEVVPGHGTRPIMDRVKTALFDILRPQMAGIDVLDLFAGSGSVGIEALSQGAASCIFVDRSYKAVATIKKNLAATGLAGRATVLRDDAFEFLKKAALPFDLIYVAPPQFKGLWREAMRRIDARPELLQPPASDPEADHAAGQVIVQIDPKEYESLSLAHLQETRQKRYGNTLLVFYVRVSDSAREGVAGKPSDRHPEHQPLPCDRESTLGIAGESLPVDLPDRRAERPDHPDPDRQDHRDGPPERFARVCD